MSADDSARIRAMWERHYNIQDTYCPKARALSEPASEQSLHDTVNALTSLSILQFSQPLGIVSLVGTEVCTKSPEYAKKRFRITTL